MSRIVALLLTPTLLAFSGSLEAQTYETSAPGALFAPYGQRTTNDPAELHVPLSQFEVRNTSGVVHLSVRTDVIAYTNANQGDYWVVGIVPSTAPPTVIFVPVTSGITPGSGAKTRYSYTPASQYDNCTSFVLVSDLFVQSDPITTHWSNTFDQPAGWRHDLGGMVPDAADGLLTLDLNTTQDGFAVTGSLNLLEHNLYDDGSHDPTLDDDVVTVNSVDITIKPAYERYASENFDATRITHEAATFVSDQVRAASGCPVIHRNYRDAMASMSTEPFIEDAPFVQIGHAYLTAYDNADSDPAVDGRNEQAVATYVLPPFWESAAAGTGTYPMLCNGFYALHGNVMASYASYAELAQRADAGDLAVMLIWNLGTGSGVTPFHRSSYMNFIELVEEASANLGVDSDAMVLFGGSRGGASALALAGNPYRSTTTPEYRAAYVLAASPLVSPYHSVAEDITATQQAAPDLIGKTMGGLANGESIEFIDAMFGTSDIMDLTLSTPPTVNSLIPDSDAHLSRIDADGTRLIIGISTHDWGYSLHRSLAYVNELDVRGIPRALAIAHGWGHAATLPPLSNSAPLEAIDIFDVLEAMYDSTVAGPFTSGQDTWHYAQDTSYLPNHPVAPVSLQVPLAVRAGELFDVTITGAPGATWKLCAIDENHIYPQTYPDDGYFVNYEDVAGEILQSGANLEEQVLAAYADAVLNSGTTPVGSAGALFHVRHSGTFASSSNDFGYDVVSDWWPTPALPRAIRAVVYFMIYNDPNEPGPHPNGDRVLVLGVHRQVPTLFPMAGAPFAGTHPSSTFMTEPYCLVFNEAADDSTPSFLRAQLGENEDQQFFTNLTPYPQYHGILDLACSGGTSQFWTW